MPSFDDCGVPETMRFFYNATSGRCEGFMDEGCNNDVGNNFAEMMTCRAVCGE